MGKSKNLGEGLVRVCCVFLATLSYCKIKKCKESGHAFAADLVCYFCGGGETKLLFPSLLPFVVIAFWWKSRSGHWWSWTLENPSASPPGKRENTVYWQRTQQEDHDFQNSGFDDTALVIAVRHCRAFGAKQYNSPLAHFVVVCAAWEPTVYSVWREIKLAVLPDRLVFLMCLQ